MHMHYQLLAYFSRVSAFLVKTHLSAPLFCLLRPAPHLSNRTPGSRVTRHGKRLNYPGACRPFARAFGALRVHAVPPGVSPGEKTGKKPLRTYTNSRKKKRCITERGRRTLRGAMGSTFSARWGRGDTDEFRQRRAEGASMVRGVFSYFGETGRDRCDSHLYLQFSCQA